MVPPHSVEDHVVAGWDPGNVNSNPHKLYQNVVARACRTCHIARPFNAPPFDQVREGIRADFAGRDLTGTDFGGCDLSGARFDGAVPHFTVEVRSLPDPDERSVELAALVRSVQGVFETYVKLNKRVPPELAVSVQSIDSASRMADTIAAHVNFKLSAKQELLETGSLAERLERFLAELPG